MQKELGFGREVVVDDIVQQRDVYTTSCHISDNKYHRFPMHKLPYVDLPGSLIQSTVDVGTFYSLSGQKLKIQSFIMCVLTKFKMLFSYFSSVTSLRYSTWCLVAAKTTVCSCGFTTFLRR